MARFPTPASGFFSNINSVVRFLIISDVVFQGACGLLGPVFALYIQDYITDGDPAVVAGIAAAIYLIVKSTAQIPAARIIDRICGERDDFLVVFWGTLVAATIPLAYLFIDSALMLYLVQAIYGLVTAITFPSYMAIFTRHIDKGQEGTEWGIYYTFTDISTAATAAIGGVLADSYGFDVVIWASVIVSALGALLLLPLSKHMHSRNCST